MEHSEASELTQTFGLTLPVLDEGKRAHLLDVLNGDFQVQSAEIPCGHDNQLLVVTSSAGVGITKAVMRDLLGGTLSENVVRSVAETLRKVQLDSGF